MVFRSIGIGLYVITCTFFYVSTFYKSEKRDFLRLFAVFHTFSRTMILVLVATSVAESAHPSLGCEVILI